MIVIRRAYLYLALGGGAVFGFVNCGGGGGGTSPTLASVSFSVKGGTVSDPTQDCQARVVWQVEPVNLTGSGGKETEQTIDKTYESKPTLTGGDWTCFHNDPTSATGLRAGTWRIQARSGAWTADCAEELTAGQNLIHFTINRAGCVRGIGYPGD